jgi:hypothetical protein
MHKLEVMLELWDSATEVQEITKGEEGIKLLGPKYLMNICGEHSRCGASRQL